MGDDEISGSETTGDFCGESDNDGQSQLYTVYFDIIFNQPFASSQVITESGQTDPSAVYVSFDTTSNPVVEAKVGISYVSTANAQLDWQTEDPGWDFGAVKAQAQQSWDQLLSKIEVSGGTYAQTQEFYSLLYKDFLQPNVTSDVNGQFMGADGEVHTLASGQTNQYGIYSGWDIYHSLAQLQAMLDPFAALGIAMLIFSLFARMALFSVADLSFVLPVTAVGYVLAALLGKFFLAEPVSPERWLGTALIFAGAALVGSTPRNTTAGAEALSEEGLK